MAVIQSDNELLEESPCLILVQCTLIPTKMSGSDSLELLLALHPRPPTEQIDVAKKSRKLA